MDRSRAWLATPTGDGLQPQAAFSGDPAKAAWLPDEAFAKAWAEYLRTGAVNDTTPPPVPTRVTATARAGEGIELTWEAEADLESGIQAFLIGATGSRWPKFRKSPSAASAARCSKRCPTTTRPKRLHRKCGSWTARPSPATSPRTASGRSTAWG